MYRRLRRFAMTTDTRLSPNNPSAQIPVVDCGGRYKSQDKEALKKVAK
jgi:hypothetical protein